MADVDLVVHPGEIVEDVPNRIRQYLDHYFGGCPPIEIVHHQVAHMASAYFCSGFSDAMCLSYDGYGDGVSVASAVASPDRGVQLLHHEPRDKSLGVFYSAFTSYLGFQISEDEYKIMGLAPYGRSGVVDLSRFVQVTENDYAISETLFRDGHMHLTNDEPMYGQRLVDFLGPPCAPGGPIEQHHMDVARACQDALEEIAIAMITRLHRTTSSGNLCIAGGVGLNCTANWRLSQIPFVDRLFVQPAASDRGLALGSALQAAHAHGDLKASIPITGTFFGSSYDDAVIEEELQRSGLRWCRVKDPAAAAADLLAKGAIVGWHQDRSEFGPRALGNRSILADPRRPETRDKVNDAIKFREWFRPFAPSVLADRADQLLELKGEAPFMTMSVPVKDAWVDQLGAVTHVDGTARVQTVEEGTAPLFHA